MTEPTQEQIKEFILWLGGEKSKSGFVRLSPDFGWHHISYWDKQRKSLDFLFKYAVPKLANDYDVYLISRHWERPLVYSCCIQNINQKGFRPIFTEHQDPALALFWVIWEVIKQ